MIMIVAAPWQKRPEVWLSGILQLILLGVTMVSYLARGSKIKALMIAFSDDVATIGQDPVKGLDVLAMGSHLMDGVVWFCDHGSSGIPDPGEC